MSNKTRCETKFWTSPTTFRLPFPSLDRGKVSKRKMNIEEIASAYIFNIYMPIDVKSHLLKVFFPLAARSESAVS